MYFILIAIIGMTFYSSQTHAQDGYPFGEGDIIINAGIGLGTTFSYGGSLGLPFGGSVEYGITDVIGVGGETGFSSGSGLSVFYIGAKGSYHFNELLNIDNEQLDLYGGLGLFYRNFSVSGISFGISSGIYPAFHLGGRYYFSEKFGVHAELGNTYGWLKAGVTFKL